MGSSLHLSQGQMAHRTLRGHTPHDHTHPTAPPSETSLSPRHNGFSRPSSDHKDQKPRVPSPAEAICSGLYLHGMESSYFLGRGGYHGSQVTDGSATGHRGGRPALDSSAPAVLARAWGAVRTSLPDGPATQRGVTPIPLPSLHFPKRNTSLCFNLALKPSPKRLLYIPSHCTPTSDPDSPPDSSPFGALCPCYFLKPYHLSPYLSA